MDNDTISKVAFLEDAVMRIEEKLLDAAGSRHWLFDPRTADAIDEALRKGDAAMLLDLARRARERGDLKLGD